MSADRITANLPAADFSRTQAFYEALGFATDYRDAGWMIMRRGSLEVEFFLFPEIDPRSSSFGACIRVDDLDGLFAAFGQAGLPTDQFSIPRLTPPEQRAGIPRIFALVDGDGSLLRCLQNGPE